MPTVFRLNLRPRPGPFRETGVLKKALQCHGDTLRVPLERVEATVFVVEHVGDIEIPSYSRDARSRESQHFARLAEGELRHLIGRDDLVVSDLFVPPKADRVED